MSTRYYVTRDDLTGEESWVRLPVAPARCHRCGQSSRFWYCRACRRVLSRRAWLPVLLVGSALGMYAIAWALALWLAVIR
jgi:hypothetical protein